MELIVLGSSSRGNCYLLKNKEECLILECGISFVEVKKALDFNLSTTIGCLVTHEHGDDSRYVKEVINCGIDVYMSAGTKGVLGIKNYRIKEVEPFNTFKIGGFTILPFDVKHDSMQPLGFVIHHEDTGSILFVSDTSYVEYSFKNLSHILLECNYSMDILTENVKKGIVSERLKNRIIMSHFEVNNVKEFLKANISPKLNNIVLLHLSDNNSHCREFKDVIQLLTFATVLIGDKELRIELNQRERNKWLM